MITANVMFIKINRYFIVNIWLFEEFRDNPNLSVGRFHQDVAVHSDSIMRLFGWR